MSKRILTTRFTKAFGLAHPVVQAPMAFISGGALAQAIQAAGGLGLIGQAYETEEWLHAQFNIAEQQQQQHHQHEQLWNTEQHKKAPQQQNVGIGFITWKLAEAPQLLEAALAHRPSVFWFSFGEAAPFIQRVRQFAAETPGYQPKVVLQVHTAEEVVQGAKLGVDAIVVQGTEAGGHGRSGNAMTTFCLVPQAVDALDRYYAANDSITTQSQTHDRVSLLAAGGIADGRGIAAALMLGADGVVMGSRFIPTVECIAHINLKKRVTEVATQDSCAGTTTTTTTTLPTFRTTALDKLRRIAWPEGYDGRVLQNPLLLRTDALKAPSQEEWEKIQGQFKAAVEQGDYSDEGGAAIFVGQCVKQLGGSIMPASNVLKSVIAEAQDLLTSAPSKFL